MESIEAKSGGAYSERLSPKPYEEGGQAQKELQDQHGLGEAITQVAGMEQLPRLQHQTQVAFFALVGHAHI